MLEVTVTNYKGLSIEERDEISAREDDYYSYLRITHNGKTILLESDGGEPEDATFCRDYGWIVDALRECYKLGRADAINEVQAQIKEN